MKVAWIAVAASLGLAGCSWFESDKPAEAAKAANAEETLKRNCADPKWREQNLGLWYSVCRQPLRW